MFIYKHNDIWMAFGLVNRGSVVSPTLDSAMETWVMIASHTMRRRQQ